jgi:streptogramin lyase
MRRLSIAPILLFLVVACGSAAGPSTPSTPAAVPTRTVSVTPTAAATPTAATATPTASGSSNESAIVATVPTADGPIILAATDDTVWVENHRSNFVSRVDPARNLEVEQLTKVNVHCEIAAGGGSVWTTEAAASSVNKVDERTGKVVASIVLSDACGIAVDDDDVWITSPGLGTIVRYDPATTKPRTTIKLQPMVFSVAIGPEAVWVVGEADGGAVYRIDPATNKLVASISVPIGFATGIVAGHGAVWVPSRDNRVVYRIDPATNAVAATIKMPSLIGGIGVGPDAMWTSGFGDGNVYRIDPATNEITASVSTGQGNLGPPLVAFGSIWVAALDQNVVLRIDPAAIQ